MVVCKFKCFTHRIFSAAACLPAYANLTTPCISTVTSPTDRWGLWVCCCGHLQLQLLQLGAFKYQPLKDFLPYDELVKMRLEDGIDATRREDYLSEDEFAKVFGVSRDAFKQMPAWKQVQAKKKSNLF